MLDCSLAVFVRYERWCALQLHAKELGAFLQLLPLVLLPCRNSATLSLCRKQVRFQCQILQFDILIGMSKVANVCLTGTGVTAANSTALLMVVVDVFSTNSDGRKEWVCSQT